MSDSRQPAPWTLILIWGGNAAVSQDKASTKFRKQNLAFEIKQLGETMKKLAAAADGPRKLGYERLKLAEEAWDSIRREGHTGEAASRAPSNAPYIFSIEMINAGSGESILVHYGTPDETRLVMINGGSRTGFKDTVWKRLHTLKNERFGGAPTPIELFVVGDQHEDKTGGLFELLMETTSLTGEDRVVEIRLVWANIFQTKGFRGAIRELLQKTGIPVNAPFDHHVMSPGRGLVEYQLPGGLEIVVIGPQLAQLHALYQKALMQDRRSLDLAVDVDRLPKSIFQELLYVRPAIRYRGHHRISKAAIVDRATMPDSGQSWSHPTCPSGIWRAPFCCCVTAERRFCILEIHAQI